MPTDVDLTSLLQERFPIFCANISCGAYVDVGWEPIVIELCQQVEEVCSEILAKNPQDVAPTLDQVKEKFGRLTIYYSYRKDGRFDHYQTSHLISEAVKKSSNVCERCGKLGFERHDIPWTKTLCVEHYMERSGRSIEQIDADMVKYMKLVHHTQDFARRFLLNEELEKLQNKINESKRRLQDLSVDK